MATDFNRPEYSNLLMALADTPRYSAACAVESKRGCMLTFLSIVLDIFLCTVYNPNL